MKIEAYWLFPDGRIHPVRTCHIQEVIKNPQEYGETLADIKRLYEAHTEKMPHEGKARVEIMKRILRRGYIRIREKRNYWVMELYKLSSKEKSLMSQWVNYVWDYSNDQHSEMKINALQNNQSIIVPIKKFL